VRYIFFNQTDFVVVMMTVWALSTYWSVLRTLLLQTSASVVHRDDISMWGDKTRICVIGVHRSTDWSDNGRRLLSLLTSTQYNINSRL